MKIIVDHREASSGTIRELARLGLEIEMQQLDVGDFILSERVGVERKTVSDFLSSMIDRRLLEQAKYLAETFERPLLILEGRGLYSERGIHPNAIRGALACLTVDYRISILPTLNEKDTAKMLTSIARREQEGKKQEIPIRGGRKALTLAEQQRFIVEGLPGVSAVLAKRLLKHFGSVEKIMSASKGELQEVHGLGTKKVGKIRRVLSEKFVLED